MDVNKGGNLISIEQATVLTFGARAFYFLLTFIVGIIVARTTGPAGKGIYSLIILTCSLAAILTGIGVGISNACFVGKKPDKVPSLVTNSVFLLIAPLVLLGIVFAGLRFTQAFEPVKLKYVEIAFALTPFMLLISLFNEILHGMNKIREFNLITIAVPVIQVVILFVLLPRLDLNLVLISWAVSQIIGVVLVSFILSRNTRIGSIDFGLLKKSLIFGVQVWLAQLIGTLSLRFDMYLVAYYLTARDVGYYSIAVTLSGFLFYMPSSIGIAALPRFTSGDAESASNIACQGMRVALFSSVMGLLILLGVGKFIVPFIYGKAFLDAVPPLLILLPGVAVYGMAHITTAYFNGYIGKPIINTGLAGISLVIDIILNIILIPRMGVSGAALSCTIAYILSMVVCIYVFIKLSGSSVKNIFLVKKEDIRGYSQLLKQPKEDGAFD